MVRLGEDNLRGVAVWGIHEVYFRERELDGEIVSMNGASR